MTSERFWLGANKFAQTRSPIFFAVLNAIRDRNVVTRIEYNYTSGCFKIHIETGIVICFASGKVGMKLGY
jgi:hypothetical protein